MLGNKKKSKLISKKVTCGKKLFMDMTTNEVKREICKFLKMNVLPEIENKIKNHRCSCHVSVEHCAIQEVSKTMKLMIRPL